MLLAEEGRRSLKKCLYMYVKALLFDNYPEEVDCTDEMDLSKVYW